MGQFRREGLVHVNFAILGHNYFRVVGARPKSLQISDTICRLMQCRVCDLRRKRVALIHKQVNKSQRLARQILKALLLPRLRLHTTFIKVFQRARYIFFLPKNENEIFIF